MSASWSRSNALMSMSPPPGTDVLIPISQVPAIGGRTSSLQSGFNRRVPLCPA